MKHGASCEGSEGAREARGASVGSARQERARAASQGTRKGNEGIKRPDHLGERGDREGARTAGMTIGRDEATAETCVRAKSSAVQ